MIPYYQLSPVFRSCESKGIKSSSLVINVILLKPDTNFVQYVSWKVVHFILRSHKRTLVNKMAKIISFFFQVVSMHDYSKNTRKILNPTKKVGSDAQMVISYVTVYILTTVV